MTKPLLKVLNGQPIEKVPFWFMRQAGRYLPEYRALREQAGGFLDMAFNPEMATEITLQPIRRFGMDAAILFSDILVVPHALGQTVRFVEGEGPRLDPLSTLNTLRPGGETPVFEKVWQAVARIKDQLDKEGFDHVARVGFAGAPWTVACYMIQGRGGNDFLAARQRAYADPEFFRALMEIITESTITYLLGQIRSGAEVIQIFDSWAGLLDETGFRDFVIYPTQKIVKALRAEYPDIPIIGFPKGVNTLLSDYIQMTGVKAVSLDSAISTKWAARVLQPGGTVLQGNLDPARLLAGGDGMLLAAEKILTDLGTAPFIFNLGHGIHKDTPVAHVEELVGFVKGWRK